MLSRIAAFLAAQRKPAGMRCRSCRMVLTASSLVTMLVSQHGAHAGQASDARQIVIKSLNTYYSMASYAGRSNTDTVLQDASGHNLEENSVAVEIKFKRPNRLRLNFTTNVGSRIVWSNATEFGVFEPLSNKYWKALPAPDADTLLPLLFKQANTTAMYDPMYGLARNTLPPQMSGFTLKGMGTYNGHQVYIISAKMGGARPADITWWIDRKSSLFCKIEMSLKGVAQSGTTYVDGHEKRTTRTVNVLIRNVVTDSRPNAVVSDSDFQFTPPPGSSPRVFPADSNRK